MCCLVKNTKNSFKIHHSKITKNACSAQFLDLSNNCIESLTGMSGAKSLKELYLSHNQLADCETLINCKTWPELSVLDLSYNPLAQSNTLRQNCLYYINSLKVSVPAEKQSNFVVVNNYFMCESCLCLKYLNL